MKTMLCMVLGLTVASVALGDEEPIKKDPKPKDFVGKWVGKWDDKWKVQFTVTMEPDSGELLVLYEWEERLGQPLQSQRVRAKIVENALVLGLTEITLPAKGKDKAKAVGKFRNTRTANLTREKE